MADAKKIDIVQKLLAKAERAGTAEEADTYRAKATELMLKHAIDDAELADRPNSGAVLTSAVIKIEGGYFRPRGVLLNAVVLTFGCKAVANRSGETITVYGWDTDVAAVQVLYASLTIQVNRECAMAQEWSTVHGRTFKTSFITGFATTVYERLKAQKATVVSEAGTGTELVLVDRSKAAERYMREQNGSLRRVAGPTVTARGAFSAGKAAGTRADIGNTRLSGSRPALR